MTYSLIRGGADAYHIKQDVIPLLNGNCDFVTCDGIKHHIDGEWDLIIAHPPCTYLTVTGNRWFNVDKYGEAALNRLEQRKEAINFFMILANAHCKHIAIENPVGVISTVWRKPDQIVQPYFFGDEASKTTCLWLKNLPNLKPTKIVGKGEWVVLSSGKRLPKWYSDALTKAKTSEERRNLRSKTFPGFAKAIAEQWGEFLINEAIQEIIEEK